MDMIERKKRLMMMQNSVTPIVWNGAGFTWTSQKYIGQTNNSAAGKEGNTPYYQAVLEFIPCSILANRTVSITGSHIDSAVLISCAFYADNNESSYITAITKDQSILVPSNAKYCRFAMRNNKPTSDFYLRTA